MSIFSLVSPLLGLSLMLCMAVNVQGQDVFRLVDGKTQAVIVGNDDLQSRVENGYRSQPHFLQYYIEKSTGKKLQLIAPDQYDPATMPYAIFTGSSPQARQRLGKLTAQIDRDGYIVEVTPQAVYLLGARDHSSEYAMIDFLEQATGTATYIPTRWGTISPHHEKIVLEPSYRLEIPVAKSRAFSTLRTYKDSVDKMNYSAQTDIPWRLYRRDAFHHNIHTFITVKEFGQSHPEYFPMRNGKRMIVSTSTGPGPCISNPQVVKIIIEKVRAWFDLPANADKDTISLGMTDGGWCECDACKAMDGLNIRGVKSNSTRYYTFLNQVAAALAQSHPGKRIGVLAYAGADEPPADMRVERNITPYICLTRANWGDPEVRKDHERQVLAWTSRVDQVGTYEYLYGGGFMVPRIYHQFLAEHLRMLAKTGGGGFYAEIYSNHALDGPKAWVTEKLVWNPFQDPAALQSRWCKALFEEAAAPMDQYFRFLETCNAKNVMRTPEVDSKGKGRNSKFFLLSDENQFDLFNVKEIEQAKAYLAQAHAATTRKEIIERIVYFEEGLRVTELSVKAYHAYAHAQKLGREKASDKEILAALIEGERQRPDEDPVLLMRELVEKDASMFTPVMPTALTTSTELSSRIVNGKPWQAIRDALAGGEKSRDALVKAASNEILAIAPANWQEDSAARGQVQMLLDMCQRIIVVPRVSTGPRLDGVADESFWVWQEDSPWWQWKSSIPYREKTQTAFAYDGTTLYTAIRCWQNDLKDRKRGSNTFGVSGWKYVSVEYHLQPDEASNPKGPDFVPRFQVIPTLGGGLWANINDSTKWKVTEGDGYWQAEMAIDLAKLHMTPERFKALRLNMIRNVKEDGHYGKGWFPSAASHALPEARGWLVFE